MGYSRASLRDWGQRNIEWSDGTWPWRRGDHFEVVTDEDDPNLIVLRRVEDGPKPSWVEVLLACPEKGWFRPRKRRLEPMRKLRL